uniref:Shugoshin_C domain-containing protein n=1 Tax=Caenorhabditis tropicalis TaxID=1561998 RepID=A0A1I7UMQ8_9PELO
MRRNSLTNMLGEFVGFNRSPGARLSSLSNQELNQAVKEEKRNFLEQEAERPEKRKPRQRYLSEGDIRVVSSHPISVSELKRGLNREDMNSVRVSANPAGNENSVDVVMRTKNSKRKDRPTSLIERIRRKISYTKTGAIIESDEEKDHSEETLSGFPKRRDSTRSERLFIPITPVEAVPIRIVQVSN